MNEINCSHIGACFVRIWIGFRIACINTGRPSFVIFGIALPGQTEITIFGFSKQRICIDIPLTPDYFISLTMLNIIFTTLNIGVL